MLTPQFLLGIDDELVVDLFAGGGGMSTGIEQAIGRHVDIAINHNADALSMHQANHPQTEHLHSDVFEVDPKKATRGRPVGLLHLSPDCTHHSQAKGGQPRDHAIRALPWVALSWAGQVRPRIITLENVVQILKWGSLKAKRCPKTGRVVRLDGTVAARGERVPLREQFLIPDKRREGETWKRYVQAFRDLGYQIEWRRVAACDHGAGTTRERLFAIARCDGQPIIWPDASFFKQPKRGQNRMLAAADGIDFSIACPSIFGRKKELAPATKRRVAKGIKRYVLDSADPFIVPATHHGGDRTRSTSDQLPTITAAHRGELMLAMPHLQQITQGGRLHSVSDGLPVVTTAKGGEQALVSAKLAMLDGKPYQITDIRLADQDVDDGDPPPEGNGGGSLTGAALIQAAHGDGKPGGVQRWGEGVKSVRESLGAITASGSGGHALAAATMIQVGYGEREGQSPRALDIKSPLGVAVAGGGKHALVSAFLAQHNTMPNGGVHPGHDVRDPSSAITASGSQQGLVAASLIHMRGNCDSRNPADPLQAISAGGEHHGVIAANLAAQRASNDSGLSPEHEAGALRVAAFLIQYYGEGGQWGDLKKPMATMTTRDRLALVTVVIDGNSYVIVDIGLRMLTPRELYNCQGFPKDYIIDRGHDGRVFSKSKQVRMCGNSVSPPPARAIIAANYQPPQPQRLAA